MSGVPPSQSVLNFVVRMVVPMRREFGRSLDVQQFMRDPAYARVVLEEAAASQDQRLREYAEYVSRHLSGAREAHPPPVVPKAPSPPAPPPAHAARAAGPATVEPKGSDPNAANAPPEPGEGSAEAELRARMLRKYTSGLR